MQAIGGEAVCTLTGFHSYSHVLTWLGWPLTLPKKSWLEKGTLKASCPSLKKASR